MQKLITIFLRWLRYLKSESTSRQGQEGKAQELGTKNSQRIGKSKLGKKYSNNFQTKLSVGVSAFENSNIKWFKPIRPITKVYIHCTASDNPDHDNIKTIDNWHRQRGFNGIGYHFMIHRGGRWSVGRSLDRMPAAQKGHNANTIAIVVHGLQYFSQEQMDSLYAGCKFIDQLFNVTFHGHCEVSNKSCPVFDYKKVLNLGNNGAFNKGPYKK